MSETYHPNLLDRNKHNSAKLSKYENNIANKLSYFGVTLNRFSQNDVGNYKMISSSFIAQLIFWGFYINTCIKIIFLCFMVGQNIGKLQFFDKIVALDYILCASLIFVGIQVWGLRYPFHGKHSNLHHYLLDNIINHKIILSFEKLYCRNSTQFLDNRKSNFSQHGISKGLKRKSGTIS